MGSSALLLILLLMSFIHAGLTQARPKPVVKVSPDQRVFRGETVTLTCDIQRGGNFQWTYSWFKDGSVIRRVTERVYTITSLSDNSGEYSCRGERSDSQRSDTSAAVTLTVSDLPRSTLTVTPNSPVFTGERVSLKCVINPDHSNWRYEWYKGSTKVSEHHTVKGNTLTIERSKTSDAGRYTCKGHIDGRSVSSQSSSPVYLSVTDSPRSTLTVTPDSPVFTGETVNLTCVIESYSNWRYEWYKGTDSVMLQTSERYTVNRDTLTIRGATESDQDQYWCRGQRDKRPKSSQSSSVSLSVTDLPRSTLTVTPDSPVFTGETVNLTCVIESYSNWRYEWYKGTGSVMLQPSERYTVNRDTLTIRGATESDQDQYWCRGQRDERPNSSQSSSVSLTVTDLPRSTLTVTPDSSVFTGETVNLTCVIESYSNWRYDNWRYEWYKGTDSVMLQSSERYTVNRDTLTIRGATESDQDQYWCRGQRDERPNSSQESERINLSVNYLPRSTLTVTPDSPVFTGETVNLKCVIESHSNWRYEWDKGTDSVMLQTSERYTVNRDTLTIKGVTASDQNLYWCRGQRDERPKSSQSSSVYLSVTARPKPVVKVTPDQRVFRGETVTLTCDIQRGGNFQWTYSWFKDGDPHDTYRTTTRTAEFSFRTDVSDNSGEYSCRGERSDSQRSDISAAVTLTVS
ncbi:B-cell receptor CD22-like, partial [Sinocyclocheilus rhinocerous]|uniref:B-cell receptor CD22-like n=1 Tax=Sinocyclocheilus rhinocerous TaxID=307959 RepID=UPI0007BAC0D6